MKIESCELGRSSLESRRRTKDDLRRTFLPFSMMLLFLSTVSGEAVLGCAFVAVLRGDLTGFGAIKCASSLIFRHMYCLTMSVFSVFGCLMHVCGDCGNQYTIMKRFLTVSEWNGEIETIVYHL